ncbi:MAG: TIGR01906 family membrane protein [Sporolactobacillus sp.]
MLRVYFDSFWAFCVEVWYDGHVHYPNFLLKSHFKDVFLLLYSRYQLQQDLFAAGLAVFLITVSVLAVLFFIPLYAWDAHLLNMSKSTGLSYTKIIENYRYMILFLGNPLPQNFHLPSLPSSVHGRIHFQDVKRLFRWIELVMIVSGAGSVWGFFIMRRRHNYFYLRRAAYWLVALTSFPLIALVLDFNDTFILFHRLAFSNNYWLFDPQRDPVITILPEAFFMHAALLIIGLIALSVAILFIASHRCYKRLPQEKE